MTTDDADQIREALERLKNSSMEIGKAIYSNTSSESTQEEPAQEAQQDQQQEEAKSEEGEKKEEKKWEWMVDENWEHLVFILNHRIFI